jgi:plastocyanin
MFVFRLLRATWRGYAALVLSLAILVSLPSDALAGDTQVTVVQPSDTMSLRYDPSSVSVTVGTTVTWMNSGSTAITVTSPDGLFDSESIAAGGSFSYTFDTPGTFRYFCVPYPHMKGVIVVTLGARPSWPLRSHGGTCRGSGDDERHFAGGAALALAGRDAIAPGARYDLLGHRPGPLADAVPIGRLRLEPVARQRCRTEEQHP